ncbi:hypothetical protein ACVWWK_003259 [Bradyrhizobium sp. LB9.1b]
MVLSSLDGTNPKLYGVLRVRSRESESGPLRTDKVSAQDHQYGGPGRTRTCNQTVMSGRL